MTGEIDFRVFAGELLLEVASVLLATGQRPQHTRDPRDIHLPKRDALG